MSTMDEEQLRAYANLFHFRQAIGPRAEYYLEQFAKFERAGGRWVVTWNWPAFFFSCAWFAYRRMGGRSLLNFFLPILFIVMSHVLVGSDLQLLVMAGYLALAFVVIPMYANTLYYRNLKALIARVAASADDSKARKLLRPPSFVTVIEACLSAVLVFLVPWFFLVAPAWYADYTPRAKVADGVAIAASLGRSIKEFYEDNKRLPANHEAEKFRVDGGKYTQSVIYDAEGVAAPQR